MVPGNPERIHIDDFPMTEDKLWHGKAWRLFPAGKDDDMQKIHILNTTVIIWISLKKLLEDHSVWSNHVHKTPLQMLYLTTILYHHHKLFIDIERENIPCVHSQCFIQVCANFGIYTQRAYIYLLLRMRKFAYVCEFPFF